jgi:uncharacterized damage-inducible protein DinB
VNPDTRTEPALDGDERSTLEGFLDYHRDTFAMKCRGLSPTQLASRAVAPSTMSLLGLARHLSDVERSWFARLQEVPYTPQYWTESEPDGDFDGAEPSVADHGLAQWRTAVAESRLVAARYELTDTFQHRGEAFSFRWLLVHLIEEYSRHNGHADLLREAIDGETGE